MEELNTKSYKAAMFSESPYQTAKTNWFLTNYVSSEKGILLGDNNIAVAFGVV